MFLDKYKCLTPKLNSEDEHKVTVTNILNLLDLPQTEWQVGKTRVR